MEIPESITEAIATIFRDTFILERSSYNPTIKSIRKLDNEELFRQYMEEKSRMQEIRKCPKVTFKTENPLLQEFFNLDQDINEALLFHGSSENAMNNIAKHGFDLKRARVGLFGRGAYFADYSAKSDQYTLRDCGSTKYMLVCRIILGSPKKYLFQHNSHSSAPTFEVKKYDSILGIRPKGVKIIDSFREFIVFEDSKIYPDFVIEYTTGY